MNKPRSQHVGRVLLLIVCSATALFIAVYAMLSINERKESKVLDAPSKSMVIATFLDLVISKSTWYNDDKKAFNIIAAKYGSALGSEDDLDDYLNLKTRSPDFAEYVYRRNGLPNPDAVHKWVAPVTIALDWQKIAVSKADGSVKHFVPFGLASADRSRPENYELFQDQILKSISIIRAETGLDISFFDPKDPRESTQDYAKIRVVPMVDPQSWRKRRRDGVTYTVSSIEEDLVTAVRLTTDETQGMDAFLIPNGDNSIGYAACKIDPLLPEDKVRKLISECLVSVLGISNMMPSVIDGKYMDQRISFLSILYCSEVKPGMNYYELISVLKYNDSCFSKFYNK